MRLSDLKKLTQEKALEYRLLGLITPFEHMFHKYLTGELSWHRYSTPEIVALRERFNLTQEALAELLMVSFKTVQRWESEGEEPPNTVCIALSVLDKLGIEVFKLMNTSENRFELKEVEVEAQGEENFTEKMYDSTLYNLSARRETFSVPKKFDAETVCELRRRLGMTRSDFAKMLGISASTALKWEHGDIVPKGPSLLILQILWQRGLEALPTPQ